jgi:hypothetical protein
LFSAEVHLDPWLYTYRYNDLKGQYTIFFEQETAKCTKEGTAGEQMDIWSQVVDLTRKPFKKQGIGGILEFRGSIQTDGVYNP